MLNKYTEILKLILLFDLEIIASGYNYNYWVNISYADKQDKLLSFLSSVDLAEYDIRVYSVLCQVDLTYRGKNES